MGERKSEDVDMTFCMHESIFIAKKWWYDDDESQLESWRTRKVLNHVVDDEGDDDGWADGDDNGDVSKYKL